MYMYIVYMSWTPLLYINNVFFAILLSFPIFLFSPKSFVLEFLILSITFCYFLSVCAHVTDNTTCLSVLEVFFLLRWVGYLYNVTGFNKLTSIISILFWLMYYYTVFLMIVNSTRARGVQYEFVSLWWIFPQILFCTCLNWHKVRLSWSSRSQKFLGQMLHSLDL